MPTLKLNVGDGLGFDQDNKLTVKIAGDNIHIVDIDGMKGLYVDDLTGSGGSVPDTWTTVSGNGTKTTSPYNVINNFVDIDRDVVNLIFTFGIYKIPSGGRGVNGQNHISYDTSQVKTVSDVCDEIDFPLTQSGTNLTVFKPAAGELLQLVDNPTSRLVNTATGTIASEDGKRSGNNTQKTMALFVINKIIYRSDLQPQGNRFWVEYMKLTCIYSDPSITQYVVGQEYDGTQTLSPVQQ